MTTVTLTINGQKVTARADATILETVEEQGLDTIPSLCHSPELPPYGSCFLCVVEVKGRPNLVPSCATRVAQDMEVETNNERIRASRKTALELLISNHYADCLPPCRLSCPAGVDTQGYLALSAMGHYAQAIDLIRRNNPLPAVCGRICVRKCELECRRREYDQPVNINAVKRFLTDVDGAYDNTPSCEPPNGKSVGIVGAGPAGLSAAWFLAGMGYETMIYEAMDRPGGMLRYGIPAYRLPDEVLDREIEYIRRRGVRIQCSTRVGSTVSLTELRKRHDALFIAAGAWAAKPMGIEGESDTAGIVDGIDFLRRMADNPTPVAGTVAVVGGGNTAMDVARTVWRLGADKVIIAYRRTKAEMPADPLELADCLREGVELKELTAPVGLVTREGRLCGLRCVRMELGEPDASGRRRPVEIKGSGFTLACDIAVTAIGQAPVLDGLLSIGEQRIALTRRKTIAADPATMKTNIDGVFAGGDAADDGPTVVVDAIRDGRQAAESIHAYISGGKLPRAPFVVRKELWGKAEIVDADSVVNRSQRREAHELKVEERRGNFEEVSLGLREEEMQGESGRCLSCGCVEFNECKLRQYAEEYGVDPYRFIGSIRKHKIDDRHPLILYDPNKCILCTRCVRTCERILPLPALGLVGRGFTSEIRPSMNEPLEQTTCIGCGNCIDACPTAALTEKYHFTGRAALERTSVETHCALCSMACGIAVRSVGENSFFIRSAKAGEYICRYGRFGPMTFASQQRMTVPLIREGKQQHTAVLSEAIAAGAKALRDAASRHGPEKVGVFVSGEMTNEELYLASLIAREGLRTNNIGSLAMLLQGNTTGAFDQSFGFTASTAGKEVIAEADLIVCSNTDLFSDHLPLSVHVTDAVRRGTELITLNSSPGSSNSFPQALVLDPPRGTTTLLWKAIMRRMYREGFLKRESVISIPGGEKFVGEFERYDDGVSIDATEVSASKLLQAIGLFGKAGTVVFIHGIDRQIDCAPHDCEVIANFMLLLRAHGIRTELLLPRIIPNGAGMEIMGTVPQFLPGKTRSRGLAGAQDSAELLTMLRDGDIRAALIIGEDPWRDDEARGCFRNAESLVAIDWKMTETVQFADIALPGTLFLETPGTRCDFLGTPVRYAPVLKQPSNIPGWKIAYNLAIALGVQVPASDIEGITDRVESVVRKSCGEYGPFYWNKGEARRWKGSGRLIKVTPRVEPGTLSPLLTHTERYKKILRDVNA
ncbi:MAG: FAD-dependent oxidoreductase [Chitinispirillaceae bacterium]|nr:FAD-dependent oxidoreductase [Chitinispirillaceae bacterium]